MKRMKSAVADYFTASAVALLFNAIQGIMVSLALELIFMGLPVKRDKWAFPTRFCLWFTGLFMYLYELHQIKGHLKEMDRIVTIRFEEA